MDRGFYCPTSQDPNLTVPCKCQAKIKTEKNLLCPFCGGEVVEKYDTYGGSWIEHVECHKDGGIQKCILTDVNLNTTSQHHAGWNNRALVDELIAIIRSNPMGCTNPVEYDYHEYAACKKCNNCRNRKRLQELGFKGFWE